MIGGFDRSEAALWRRWSADEAAAGEAAAEPDALLLAAYAAHRLGRTGGDPEYDSEIMAIEGWLASHPEALDDILAARAATTEANEILVPATALSRAEGLVAGSESGVVSLGAHRGGWRRSVAAGGIAASLIAASLVGFSIGLNDWLSIGSATRGHGMEAEMFGPPAPLLGGLDEDSAT